MHPTLSLFQAFYCDFKQSISQLDQSEFKQLYSDDIHFIDPVHSIKGLAALEAYLAANPQLSNCRFTITNCQALEGQAYLEWQMHYAHPKIACGRIISIDGISHIKFDEKITYQRDYYDLGAMVYEHIPVMGRFIKHIKQRVSQ